MQNSPAKKKKNKKGHKKKNVKEEKDALQEVDRTMYNIQIADLTEKLARYYLKFYVMNHIRIINNRQQITIVRLQTTVCILYYCMSIVHHVAVVYAIYYNHRLKYRLRFGGGAEAPL